MSVRENKTSVEESQTGVNNISRAYVHNNPGKAESGDFLVLISRDVAVKFVRILVPFDRIKFFSL